MRWPKSFVVLLGMSFLSPALLIYAQSDNLSGIQARPASQAATEEEVAQLRQEVAELRATVQQLVQANSKVVPAEARLVEANFVADSSQPDAASPAETTSSDIYSLRKEIDVLQKNASDTPPATAGWNDEHFFLRSSNGNFTLMPIGYLNANYTFYKGDGAPPDTFSIRRARFGVQGSYGKQVDYAFLFESASSISIRDAFLEFKPWSFFNIIGGQFRVPFSHEVATPDTNFEFSDRSITTVLLPDVSGAFRAPGIEAYGDLAGGRAQYWVGLFNGQGLLESGTTNEPEVVGRIRLNPWKQSENPWLKRFSLGVSAEHSRSKGLANEQSFSGLLSDNTYTFFPQFRINGGIERYNGFFYWLNGPLGLRGEYTQILQERTGIGSFAPNGNGFNSLPGVVGKGAYGILTYLLTGEREPENTIPRVKHPVIGPNSPGETGGPGWGAWQLKFRYSWLEGKARGATCDATTIPACPISPGTVPTFSDHTSQITAGFNWYLNYWVLVKSDLNIDQLKNPSVQGILPRNYIVFSDGIQFRF
jgi:Phosphate-selective porin O and P